MSAAYILMQICILYLGSKYYELDQGAVCCIGYQRTLKDERADYNCCEWQETFDLSVH